jgi:F-type H+-transporting ATPase subunit alpha
MPDVLAEFKKGNLAEDGVKRMVTLANELKPRFA